MGGSYTGTNDINFHGKLARQRPRNAPQTLIPWPTLCALMCARTVGMCGQARGVMCTYVRQPRRVCAGMCGARFPGIGTIPTRNLCAKTARLCAHQRGCNFQPTRGGYVHACARESFRARHGCRRAPTFIWKYSHGLTRPLPHIPLHIPTGAALHIPRPALLHITPGETRTQHNRNEGLVEKRGP